MQVIGFGFDADDLAAMLAAAFSSGAAGSSGAAEQNEKQAAALAPVAGYMDRLAQIAGVANRVNEQAQYFFRNCWPAFIKLVATAPDDDDYTRTFTADPDKVRAGTVFRVTFNAHPSVFTLYRFDAITLGDDLAAAAATFEASEETTGEQDRQGVVALLLPVLTAQAAADHGADKIAADGTPKEPVEFNAMEQAVLDVAMRPIAAELGLDPADVTRRAVAAHNAGMTFEQFLATLAAGADADTEEE